MRKILILLFFSMLYGLPVWSQAYNSGGITAVDTSATCSTTGGFVLVNVLQNSSSVAFTVSGTFSGTLQFVGTVDGTSWVAVNAFPPNSTTAATSTTGTGTWKADVASLAQFCVRASAFASGTATIGMRNSSGVSTSTLSTSGGGSGTIAIPATVSGATSGGIPCFDSSTDMNTSAAIASGVLIKGGGAGACAAASSLTDNGTTVTGTEPYLASSGLVGTPSIAFSAETTLGFFRRAAGVISIAQGGSNSFAEIFSGNAGGFRAASVGQISWTSNSNSAAAAQDTAVDRFGPKIVGISDGTNTAANAFLKSGMTVTTAADVTCGTSGTIANCTSATTITGLTITLPLVATNWTFTCDGVVGQATGVVANQWLIQTATNGATNTTAYYTMGTAATAMAVGAVTDQASTTTAFQITPSWTLGGTGTKMPFHIWGTITGASASGTVFNLQVINSNSSDLLTIYEGASCSLMP